MIGNNEIVLNEQTLCAAVQHWFDNVMFATGKAPRVQSVKADKSGNYERTNTFAVAVCEKPTEPAKV